MIDVYKDEETGIWVSYNSEYDLYSQGNTKEEAREAIELGVETYLKICRERGISLKE